jgi:hypothetical protein
MVNFKTYAWTGLGIWLSAYNPVLILSFVVPLIYFKNEMVLSLLPTEKKYYNQQHIMNNSVVNQEKLTLQFCLISRAW